MSRPFRPAGCDQCGTVDNLTPTEHGNLCPVCAHRQAERDQYGHGLTASTFGFLSEVE